MLWKVYSFSLNVTTSLLIKFMDYLILPLSLPPFLSLPPSLPPCLSPSLPVSHFTLFK